MEEIRSEGELGEGYMLVPWPSWDQWDFVRESLFSPEPESVAAALRRITAWRSRGCLPVAIQVTAAIIEIQQKDPYFSQGLAGDALTSEDMLAMLYSMAIMRLVNGFVEKVTGFDNHAHKHNLKKRKRSISQLADALGIPRIVVDIRHESSHRDLPSLPLLRHASVKALDWLKSHYWEPQRKAIPNVRKEARCRVRQMFHYMKLKHAQHKGRRTKQSGPLVVCSKLSSQMTGKLLSSKHEGAQKQISRISKSIARLYSEYPMEVVSELLDIFRSQVSNLTFGIGVSTDDSSSPQIDQSEASINNFKEIIIKLSSKRPGLLLTLLKEVLWLIDTQETDHNQVEERSKSLNDQTVVHQTEHLSSLVRWLLTVLRELKESGQIELINESKLLSASPNVVPKVSLIELLRKCLVLSASGNRHLSESVLFLAQMIADNSLTEKLKKLHALSLPVADFTAEVSSNLYNHNNLIQEDTLALAKQEFDALKSRLKERGIKHSAPKDGNPGASKMWSLAKSWAPCPIGMLPCSFSSTAFVPALEKCSVECEDEEKGMDNNEAMRNLVLSKRDASQRPASLENSVGKKLKEMPRRDHVEDANGAAYGAYPMKGRLLIDGIWRKVGKDELLAIETNIKILV